MAKHHCTVCGSEVSWGTVGCPVCSAALDWIEEDESDPDAHLIPDWLDEDRYDDAGRVYLLRRGGVVAFAIGLIFVVASLSRVFSFVPGMGLGGIFLFTGIVALIASRS